jgi:peroxiredoxin
MKRQFPILIVLFFLLLNNTVAQKAQVDENKLLNQSFPEIKGQTINGSKIDKAYFKGKVTLVNFMFIGCLPCMKEIGTLNKLYRNNKTNWDFQILGIAANTADQLKHFNSEDTTIYSRIRKTLKTEPIAYELLAGCEKEKEKPANSLGAECPELSQKFSFNGYPISFLIDKKGIVRKIYPGFPINESEEFAMDESGKLKFVGGKTVNSEFLKEMQAAIDSLLKE